jgi:hypothetical protein
VVEDAFRRLGLGDEGDELHPAGALGAGEHVDGKDLLEQVGPGEAVAAQPRWRVRRRPVLLIATGERFGGDDLGLGRDEVLEQGAILLDVLRRACARSAPRGWPRLRGCAACQLRQSS